MWILRLDLLPEYETGEDIQELMELILKHVYEDFHVRSVIMKAQEDALNRRNVLKGLFQKPMSEFTEGVNTYRIVPITMQSRNADQLIRELQEKQESGGELTKEDLVPLTLCLLVGGEMPLKDRVEEAYRITRGAGSVGQDKIEAVLYIMADKFLESAEKKELMEAVGMTELGQLLVNRGIEQGSEQERIKIAKNMIGTLDEKMIAEKTDLPMTEAEMEAVIEDMEQSEEAHEDAEQIAEDGGVLGWILRK